MATKLVAMAIWQHYFSRSSNEIARAYDPDRLFFPSTMIEYEGDNQHNQSMEQQHDEMTTSNNMFYRQSAAPSDPHQLQRRHRSSFEFSGSNDSSDERDQPLLWTNHDQDEGGESSDNSQHSTIVQRHYASTAAICLCTFTHSWLLVSVFPYAGFMVIKLVPGTTEENAGSYAGLLSAAFMLGRAVTSYNWGKISDVYGRRIVLFVSLILSAIFSVLFGLSKSFEIAFLWRFLLGASNGVAGISKTIVSETAEGDETLETRGMSLSMGMWGWGFLLSPALAGYLSDPLQQYPHFQHWLPSSSALFKFLQSYPFSLPNFVSVFLCLLDVVAVKLWVPETLPNQVLLSPSLMISDCCNWMASCCHTNLCRGHLRGEEEEQPPNLSQNALAYQLPPNPSDLKQARMIHTESVSLLSTSSPCLQPATRADSTASISALREEEENATMVSLWAKRNTRNHLMLYWVFSFVAIAIDEAFPLFCISKTGGLAMTAREIGKLLSATGLIFAASQYHVYAWIVDKYGLTTSIQIGACLSAPLVTLVPVSLIFHHSTSTNDVDGTRTLSWSAFVYLGILLAVCRIFGLVFFSSVTIATNRTVIPSQRGTMNGLSMLGGSIAKGLGPIFAGWLTAFGISSGTFPPKVGAVVVFLVIGLSAAFTAIMTLVMLREKDAQELPASLDRDDDDQSIT
jgi:MFS family permease